MAHLAERALAQSLKELLQTKSLDDITVQQLCDRTGVNRKTFYYHFSGIHELVQWILHRDMQEVIHEEILPDTWKRDMLRTLVYLKKDRRMIMNILHSRYWPETRMYLNNLLDEVVRNFTAAALAQYRKETNKALRISEADLRHIAHFYSTALFICAEEWLAGGMKEPPEALPERMDKLMNESMLDTFERFARTEPAH